MGGFAEAHSHLLNTSIVESEKLGDILEAAPKPAWTANTYVGKQLKNVASVIMARNHTGNEREVFYVQSHGWDSHFSTLKPGSDVYIKLQEVNDAVAQFEAAMKADGMWDDVVLVSSSDFGRKLVANNDGTDHAWGGHYFVAGGSVRGGQILGQYPSRLDESNEQNIYNSGGRFIPTTSWEAVWKPIAEWFGVAANMMAEVLPNIANFPSDHFVPKTSMFKS